MCACPCSTSMGVFIMRTAPGTAPDSRLSHLSHPGASLGLSQTASQLISKWAVQDSNLRPPACKAGALPAELTARAVRMVAPAAGILARPAPIHERPRSPPFQVVARVRIPLGALSRKPSVHRGLRGGASAILSAAVPHECPKRLEREVAARHIPIVTAA